MSKRHFAVAAVLAAFTAALPTAAEAGPCILGVNSTFVNNTCIGTGALARNTNGSSNTAVGTSALNYNANGSNNTATGFEALRYNNTGYRNTASGAYAMGNNVTGYNNTASGADALRSNTNGNNNTASGAYAMSGNTTGNENVAFGVAAMSANSTGYNNTAIGYAALYSNTKGYYNTAVGTVAYANQSSGSNNTAVGYNAGPAYHYINGDGTIMIGSKAGSQVTSGSSNIIIGNIGENTDMFTLRIGTLGSQQRAFIAGIRGATVTGGQAVVVDANGQLGVISSSRRYKQDIQPMGEASSPLMQLRPVTFHYKKAEADGSKPMQYGLIAEEVEQVMPGLVVYNKDGSPESVAYHLLPSLLLNEYQKQGRELTAAKNELAQTTARLEAMDAELAALKLAVSRLAAAPSPIQLAASKP